MKFLNNRALYLSIMILVLILTSCSTIKDDKIVEKINEQILVDDTRMEELEILDCSNLEITDLSGLRRLKSLRSLNLSNNAITDLSELQYLKNLKVLDIQNNNIEDLSPLNGLDNLDTLYIKGNNIQSLDNLGPVLDNIVESDFVLDGSFDPELEKIVNKQIGDNITSFNIRKIKKLNLKGTKVRSLKHINEFSNLEVLKADNVTDFEYIKGLVNLRELQLTNSNVSELDILENMNNLKILDLSNNKIENIEQLSKFKKLKSLNLKYNNVSYVDPLANLNLEEIYLKSNPIEEYYPIDAVIEKAKKTDVYVVYFSDENLNNAIREELNVKSNYISLSKLKNIKRLDLSNKNISSIGGIETLSGIIELDLSFNKIKDIDNLKSLTNLKVLRLNNNKITNISTLAYLKDLKLLDLSSNKIKEVESLLFLPNLKYLYLKGNRIYNNSIKNELKAKLEITDEW